VAETKSGGTNPIYWIFAVVALAALAIVGTRLGGGALGQTATGPIEVEGLDDPGRLVELAQGMVLGDPNAPVTIYEFGDYQCPSCGMFAAQIKPLIESAYVSDGRAKFVFYDFPLVSIHPNAFLAARASRCAADQGAYWEYHRKLFDEQPNWSASSSPVGLFVRYAEAVEIEADDFESCVKSDRHAAVVTAQMRLGEALGVGGTPTVMVSKGEGSANRLADASFPFIQEAVDALLAEDTEGEPSP